MIRVVLIHKHSSSMLHITLHGGALRMGEERFCVNFKAFGRERLTATLFLLSIVSSSRLAIHHLGVDLRGRGRESHDGHVTGSLGL